MKFIALVSCFLGVSSSVTAFSSTTSISKRTTTTTTTTTTRNVGPLFAGLVEGGGDKPSESSPTAPSFGNAMNINPGLITDRNQVISEPFGNAMNTNPGLLSDRINQDISQRPPVAPLATMGRDQKKKGNNSNSSSSSMAKKGPKRVTMDENNWQDILGPSQYPYVKQMNSGEEAASLDEIVYRQLERGVWVSSPGNRDFNRGYNREFTTMHYM